MLLFNSECIYEECRQISMRKPYTQMLCQINRSLFWKLIALLRQIVSHKNVAHRRNILHLCDQTVLQTTLINGDKSAHDFVELLRPRKNMSFYVSLGLSGKGSALADASYLNKI